MPNRVVSRTQVPVELKDLVFTAVPTIDRSGDYVRHEVELHYQARDDAGNAIGPRADVHNLALTAAQRTSLASFLTALLAHANAREGT